MSDTVILILLIFLMFLAAVVLPQYLTARAVPKVLQVLREQNAVGAQNAQPADQLGLVRKPFGLNRVGPRDYKPKALQLLMKLEVVLTDDDGRIFLSEEGLAKTVFSKHQANS